MNDGNVITEVAVVRSLMALEVDKLGVEAVPDVDVITGGEVVRATVDWGVTGLELDVDPNKVVCTDVTAVRSVGSFEVDGLGVEGVPDDDVNTGLAVVVRPTVDMEVDALTVEVNPVVGDIETFVVSPTVDWEVVLGAEEVLALVEGVNGKGESADTLVISVVKGRVNGKEAEVDNEDFILKGWVVVVVLILLLKDWIVVVVEPVLILGVVVITVELEVTNGIYLE